MINKNELSFILMIILIVLEDLQLTFFAWRTELFNPDTGFDVIQYIFSPGYYLSRKATVAFYIASFVLLLLTFGLAGLCAADLSSKSKL
jgi:hypothetical protein